jgi:hypothetical protein
MMPPSNISSQPQPCDLPFKHLPLEHPLFSIRLLSIQPVEEGDPIVKCSLEHYTSPWPRYKALSYTWGDDSNNKIILINGRSFEIRQNLWQFLREMRNHPSTSPLDWDPKKKEIRVLFWIDAICIDQADIERAEITNNIKSLVRDIAKLKDKIEELERKLDEKNTQVGIMRKIYRFAGSVSVWLGSDEQNSDMAIDLIKNIGMRGFSKLGTIERRALMALFQRPYWKRIWIVQEILTAKPEFITVFCGSRQFSWDQLQRFMNSVKQSQSKKEGFHDKPADEERAFRSSGAGVLVHEKKVWELSFKVDSIEGESLASLITKYADFESTEPLDKVYALLMLSRANIKVDYRKDPKALCSDVLEVVAETEKDIPVFEKILKISLGLAKPESKEGKTKIIDWEKSEGGEIYYPHGKLVSKLSGEPGLEVGIDNGVQKQDSIEDMEPIDDFDDSLNSVSDSEDITTLPVWSLPRRRRPRRS